MRAEVAFDASDGVGESAVWSQTEKALYWVDIIDKTVQRLEIATGRHDSWQMPDFPTAVALRERNGLLIAMARSVRLFDLDREPEIFVVPEPEILGNRLNEGRCDPQGRFWVGSMQTNLNPDGSEKEMTADTGRIYRVGPDAACTLADADHVYGISNTMAWRSDGAFLFADSLADTIYRFDYDAESGSIANRVVYAKAPGRGLPDGSTLDADGYLWNARFGGSCIIRFAPDGNIDRIVELPVTNPTSCTFGGDDLRTLFVTSARFTLSEQALVSNPREGGLLALDVGVAGTPEPRFAGP